MSKGDTFESDLLKLIFNATTIVGIARDASSPDTGVSVALHTADPGEAGTQATSEAAYTSYTRVTMPRTTTGWTVTNNSVSPASTITFPTCTGSSSTVTHFSVGQVGGGTSKIFYSGTVTPNITVTTTVTPTLTTSSTITED
jgi:hypothetical protein